MPPAESLFFECQNRGDECVGSGWINLCHGDFDVGAYINANMRKGTKIDTMILRSIPGVCEYTRNKIYETNRKDSPKVTNFILLIQFAMRK